MQTSLSYHIHGLVIIPDFTLVELHHDVEGPLGSPFIGVLEHIKDEILELFVDAMVLMRLVDLLDIVDDHTVEESTQLLILALEQLEEDREDYGCRDDILATHDPETSNDAHSDGWVQYLIVLLEQVQQLRAEKPDYFIFIDPRQLYKSFNHFLINLT